MQPDDQRRLRRNLDAADDDALAALANRGLVRRAAKDRLGITNWTIDESESGLTVRGDDWTVTMPPAGPTEATDDTTASGITRQILAATMHLRDHWHPPGPGQTGDDGGGESIDAEPVQPDQSAGRLAGLSIPELFKWAGKTPVLEASARIQRESEVAISDVPTLSVVFSGANVRVVRMGDADAKTTAALLDQFKTTAAPSDHAMWVMMAVMACKRAAGIDTAAASDPEADLSQAVWEDRLATAAQTRSLLASIAASGLAHPSTRVIRRLRSAAVMAEAARFPRLARLVTGIADDAAYLIARDARGDVTGMIDRVVLAHALATAASRNEAVGRTELFGRSRSLYRSAGDLELMGLGAHGWVTPSGFEGVTATFWDAVGGQFLTATVSRGEGADRTFSIPLAYQSGVGWTGGSSLAEMSRSRIALSGVKMNDQGRLSLSAACRVEILGPSDPDQVDFGDRIVLRRSELFARASQTGPMGLRLVDPRDGLLVVRPTQWGNRWFDELDQSMVWDVVGDDGAVISIRVPWTEVDEPAIAMLESIKPDREHLTAILGRWQIRAGELNVYPMSFFSSGSSQGDRVLNPQFDAVRIESRNKRLLDRLREKHRRVKTVRTSVGAEDDTEGSDSFSLAWSLSSAMADGLAGAPPMLRRMLVELDDQIGGAIESGAGGLHPAAGQAIAISADRARRLGLTALADSLDKVTGDRGHADDVLGAAYRLRLAKEALGWARLTQ